MKAFLISVFLVFSLFSTASAGGGNEKHTICHATGSDTNPFKQITIAPQAVVNAHIDHQHGEDIIPPFTYNGVSYVQNWDAEGQAIFNNGCVVPQPTVEPTAEPTEVPPTAVPTAAPTEVPTEVVTPEPTAEPTLVPTEVTTPEPTAEPTAESTPVPTQASTPVPTVEQTPEATPTVVELPNTGSSPSSDDGVPLYATLGVASLLLATTAIGVRKGA